MYAPSRLRRSYASDITYNLSQYITHYLRITLSVAITGYSFSYTPYLEPQVSQKAHVQTTKSMQSLRPCTAVRKAVSSSVKSLTRSRKSPFTPHVTSDASTEPKTGRTWSRPLVHMHSEGYCSWVVCLSVCVYVSQHHMSEHLFIFKTLSHTQRATKIKIFVGFSLKPHRCRDPALPAWHGYLQSAIFTLQKMHMRIIRPHVVRSCLLDLLLVWLATVANAKLFCFRQL